MVWLIVSVGKRAIAIGIPRNDVFPINPASCKEKFGNIFLNTGIKLIKTINKVIVMNARTAELIKSIFIPAFISKPITLMGIPYLIK